MRIHKQPTLLFFLILSMMAATVFADHQKSQQEPSASTKEEATLLQEGVLTEKQKAHSKLHKNKASSDRNIFEDVRKRGDIIIVIIDESIPSSVKDITCAADAVVIGVIQNKASQVTEEKSFIFTDYDLIVEDVLKPNSASSINPFTSITISHPGGVVGINGNTATFKVEAFKPFQVGRKYLLFLKYLPLTNSYQLASSNGSFLVEGEKVSSLKRKQLLDISNDGTAQEILRLKISTAINTCNGAKGSVSK